MVQVVFLHGVANRQGSAYKEAEWKRNKLLKEIVFGRDTTIQSPYWGEFGANPTGGVYKSLPNYDDPNGGGVESLNVGDVTLSTEVPGLVQLAREDFPETVDLIFQNLLQDEISLDHDIDPELLKSAQEAITYAINIPNPQWLETDLSDDQFLSHLSDISAQFATSIRGANESVEVETLGVGSWIKEGAKRLVERVKNGGGRLVLANKREEVHSSIATFIGDVFSYLADGAGRRPIRKRLHVALKNAVDSGEQIVLIGHSMGGVILVDCLGDPEFCAEAGLNDEKQVDALITVGSQSGFFHELNLLSTTGETGLTAVSNWINIFDEVDILSFRASPLFIGSAVDMLFSSKTGLLDSHTAYFSRIQFYERLRLRLKDIGISVI